VDTAAAGRQILRESMSFRIKSGERVDDAVRRIVDEQLAAARREATDERAPLDERVHAIRSRLKKARAALRLVDRAGGPKVRAEERALRDLARSLARARDADVSRATLRALSRGKAPRDPTAAERAAEGRDLHRALRRLEAVRRAAVDVPHGGRAAREAFARSYRKARRLMLELRPDASGPRFHEWRKVVKRLALQARILRAAAAKLPRALDGPLDHLPDLLGEIHDLSVLHARLEERDGPAVGEAELRTVLTRLRAASHAKRVQALTLGARVFGPKPRDVRDRLDAGWRVWRR
jgi:CHAD domain-containing protein